MPIAQTPPKIPSAEELNRKMDQCLALQKNKNQVFGRFGEPGTGNNFGDWIVFEAAAPELAAYNSLSFWKNNDLQDVVLEDRTPSGDWYRVDDYCFNSDGTIVGLYSDFRTLQGETDFQYIREWLYQPGGTEVSHETKLLNLDDETPLQLDPDEIEYYDHPPYEAKNYRDLLRHLEVPENLLK